MAADRPADVPASATARSCCGRSTATTTSPVARDPARAIGRALVGHAATRRRCGPRLAGARRRLDHWIIELDGVVAGSIQASEESDPDYRHAGSTCSSAPTPGPRPGSGRHPARRPLAHRCPWPPSPDHRSLCRQRPGDRGLRIARVPAGRGHARVRARAGRDVPRRPAHGPARRRAALSRRATRGSSTWRSRSRCGSRPCRSTSSTGSRWLEGRAASTRPTGFAPAGGRSEGEFRAVGDRPGLRIGS